MKKYILAVDQGTTSSRAIIFDQDVKIVSMVQKELTQFYPQPGWVEHDANEIWQITLKVIVAAIKKAAILPEQIAALGITNQRETTIVWDAKTGRPIHNAIVWQDRRTAGICDELKDKGLETRCQQGQGLGERGDGRKKNKQRNLRGEIGNLKLDDEKRN